VRASLALVALCFLAGCPDPPTDPDLAKPCGARRALAMTLGTGAAQYEAIDPQSVLIETGPQGGNHIWMGIACRGLGPEVELSYGIKEIADGTDVTGTLELVVDLAYDPSSDTDQAAGIHGYFQVDPLTVVGKQVTLWAEATDTCSATPVRAEAQALVTGFDP
jgi:hypothetical protein